MNKTLMAGVSGALACVFAMPALAADDPLTIVVTASRRAETVDESMAPVTIVDRKKIEQSGAVSVPEILATVPGVIISNNGGVGQQTSLFLRGTESDHTLVLIDGIKVGSATLGAFSYQNLSLDQVEKIEIVRGPRSSLYGSEAIGGVIQFFTRKGGNGTKPGLSVSAGSHNTTDLNVGLTGGTKRGWYAINASNYSTDGFNACRGSLEAGCFTIEPDDDGYENTSVSLRGGTSLNDALSLEAGVLNSDSDTEFDGSFQNETESQIRTSHIRFNLQATENWASNLLLAQSDDKSKNFLDGVFASQFDTDRKQLSWQNDLLINGSNLTLGVDYIDDEIESDTPFTVNNRDNTGVFAALRTQVGTNDFEISLRGDDNEQFGSETTGGLSLARGLGHNTRVTLSYGTAFKAPTFNELYFPGFGNPNLTAETSESFDLGLSGQVGSGKWSANLFYTEIDDLIGFDPLTFAPVNIDKAEISGLELVSTFKVSSWILGANLTLQDPKDASGGINDGNQLARRAKQILQINVSRQFSKLLVGASLLSRGDSFDDLGNTVSLESYTKLDLHAEYRVHKNWVVGLQINNALDEEYETAAFYNQDGVNALATLRFSPQ